MSVNQISTLIKTSHFADSVQTWIIFLMMKPDRFLGTWELIADQSRYEFGQPPAGGTYTITANETGYSFTIHWTTADGQQLSAAYDAIPDGQQYPYENTAVADAVSMTRVNEQQLDSASFKSNRQIAHAARILSADGQTMTITQSGQTPDGTPFSNISVYQRHTAK